MAIRKWGVPCGAGSFTVQDNKSINVDSELLTRPDILFLEYLLGMFISYWAAIPPFQSNKIRLQNLSYCSSSLGSNCLFGLSR
jgi:hypothetical protein